MNSTDTATTGKVTSERAGRATNVVLSLVGLLVVGAVGLVMAVDVYWIPGPAMEPTINVADRVVVNKLDTSPEPGDVIVFRRPDPSPNLPNDLVKRVIAVGGDTVQAFDNQVLVNGEPITEPYLDDGTVTEDFGPVDVPAGQLFVMGDNRDRSLDSRFELGTVPVDDVVGTVLGR